MRRRTMLFSVAVVLAGLGFFGVMQPFAQDQDEDVRGAFLTTRPKPAEKSSKTALTSKPSRRRPKTTESKPTGTSDGPATTGTKIDDRVPPRTRAQKIGLGLTLFTRDANGLAVRTDPTSIFRSGDRVRVLLETNANGFLYIFNTTDGGKPVMIYPSAELDEGGNYIQSHVPFEIPSSVGEDERLRWLTFDRHAGAERLFFVFTRDPLPTVPAEDDLIKYCRDSETKCPIQPAVELWTQIQTESSAPLQIARAEKYGRAETASERDASTRGIGLSKDDPQPSLVMMTSSANAGMLVAILELVHK